jgi:hypothetical protein
LLVTGHALEWWSLAPSELLPPRETLVKAGQWTVNAILELDDETILKRYGPLSHAGRALAMWRGLWPYQVELDPSKPLARKTPAEPSPVGNTSLPVGLETHETGGTQEN